VSGLSGWTGFATYHFHRLFCDLNGDATIDDSDLQLFDNGVAANDPICDFNNDGIVGDVADFIIFESRFGLTLAP
jgi:hypothetical protein